MNKDNVACRMGLYKSPEVGEAILKGLHEKFPNKTAIAIIISEINRVYLQLYYMQHLLDWLIG